MAKGLRHARLTLGFAGALVFRPLGMARESVLAGHTWLGQAVASGLGPWAAKPWAQPWHSHLTLGTRVAQRLASHGLEAKAGLALREVIHDFS